MAKLVSYQNILNPLDRQTKQVFCNNVKDLVSQLDYDPTSYDLIITKNQDIVDLDTLIDDNDIVSIAIVPKGGGGGGGKDIVKTVALIAVAVAAPYAAGAMMGATAGMVGAGVYGGLSGAMIYGGLTIGIAVGGSMLINSIMPPQTPDLNLDTSSFDSFKTSPTYSWEVSGNSTEQGGALPVLYGTHRVTPPIISKFVETVDNKQYLNILYALTDGELSSIDTTTIKINDEPIANFSGASVETRLGTNSQTTIPYFDDVITDKNVNQKVTTSYITSSTIGNAVTGLTIGLTAPRGLWYANDSGGLNNISVKVILEYSSDGIIWTSLGTKTLTGNTQSTLRFTYNVDNLPASNYQVRAKFVTAPSTGSRYGTDIYFEYIQERVSDDFTYPNTALLGLRILATDQLSGSIPRVSILLDNGMNNPSDIAKDILVRSGETLTADEIAQFDDWASFCTSKSYTANIYFDRTFKVRKALDIVGSLGRGNVMQFGSSWDIIIDKPDLLPTQGFMFTMGNITKDSFSEEFLPLVDRANRIEMTYWDEDVDYQPQIIEVSNANYDAVNEINKSTVSYVGCTNKDMALKYAKYLLNSSRYLTITQSFEVDTEAIVCRVGDVVKVAHDVPQIGLGSGRIVSGTTTSIVLDREIVIDADTHYIEFRYSDDDTLQSAQIVETNTTTDTLTLTAPLAKAPNEYDIYSVGKLDSVTKLMRVVNITKTSDQRSRISCLEYVSEVYDDAISVIPAPEQVLGLSGLQINEYLEIINGNTKSSLSVTWRGSTISYKVFLNDVLYQEVFDNKINIIDLQNDIEYTVRVVDGYGNELSGTITPTLIKPDQVTNVTSSFANGVIYLSWDKNIEANFSTFEVRLNGRTYRTVDNSLSLIDLDIGTYSVDVFAINDNNTYSDVTNYSLVVKQPTLMFSIRDAYLIEQAFLDGLITIYTSTTEPTANQRYDLWKVDSDSITVDEWAYNSTVLDGVTWESGQDYNLFKYWNGTDWIFCTPDQTAVARRMLGQVTEAGLIDSEVRIFSTTPYTPYSLDDLWIDGTIIKKCTTARATGAYNAADWTTDIRESVSVSTKLENVILSS